MNRTTFPIKKDRIVVVGAGFAGIETVKTLLKKKVNVEVVLLSKTPLFQYYPALYKLVTGALPIEVSVPIDIIFPAHTGVRTIIGTYTGIDQVRQVATYTDTTGTHELSYDCIVLALGSETNYFDIPGLAALSFSFKSVPEALRLKQHFCDIFSRAVGLSKDEIVPMLHVVVVGGGPSGVELAGDLRSYLTDLAKTYTIDPNLITIDLIESGNRILQALPEKVSKLAERRLRKLGVNIFTGRVVQSQDIASMTTRDMKMSAQTVVWTAGTRINQSFLTIPDIVLTDKKRLVVGDTLTLDTNPRVFIAGDGAGTAYSGLAQTAIHHGVYIGNAIAQLYKGKQPAAYQSHTPAYVIPVGNYWAVLQTGSFIMSGFVPWIIRSAIDFFYFTSIVPLKYVFAVFQQGKKYRSVTNGQCDTPMK